jgi:SAM-dependent methyltransferase
LIVRCTVCGDESPRPKFRKQGVDILECRVCGVAFWTPPADFCAEDVYDGAYFEDASAAHGYDDYQALEPVLRRNFARRIEAIPRPAPGSRLLDLGAAFGFAVSEAQRLGWDATGLEVSAAAAAAAGRAAPGHVVVANALRTPFAADSFDVVTLWDVIEEHLPDPHAAVAEVARLLRRGGRLVLTTGDVGSFAARLSGPRWHLYTIPEHLFFYTRRSLRILLEAHGFRIESQRAESSVYTLGYLVERLRKTLLRRSQAGPALWPGAGLSVPVNLGDIVTLHAIREGTA